MTLMVAPHKGWPADSESSRDGPWAYSVGYSIAYSIGYSIGYTLGYTLEYTLAYTLWYTLAYTLIFPRVYICIYIYICIYMYISGGPLALSRLEFLFKLSYIITMKVLNCVSGGCLGQPPVVLKIITFRTISREL